MMRWIPLLALLFSWNAQANICGTDFQNFNPTTNGLDFVTVQSSETLKPCVLNMGLFFNYAANSLSYSQAFNGVATGSKANDRILGADISLGFGVTENFDVGVSVPFVLSQELKDNVGVAYYENQGATEVKLGAKYRFYGDDTGGFAAVFSVNNNLIRTNPFVGDKSNPIFNLELAMDTTIENWAMAVNVGYRKRTPGNPIPNQPFLPLKDQWTYSAAGSYLFDSINMKLILEIFGAAAVNKVDYDANRSLNSLEGLVGIKKDLSNAVAFHVGGGTKIGDAIGNPDWRVYTGFNWAMGPLCEEDVAIERIQIAPPAPVYRENLKLPEAPDTLPEVYRISVAVLFDTDSDKIKSRATAEIRRFIETLQKTGFKRIEIIGHTDSVGPAEYNDDLSQRRAASVKRFITERYKVAANQVTTFGMGENQPIASNGNYQGRQKNRRVEFKVWK